MPLRSYKPTSPGRAADDPLDVRGDHDRPSRTSPCSSRMKRGSGRNNQGRLTVRHRGGGEKTHYRVIDFKRDKLGRAGAHRDDRVRPEPVRAHRPAPLPRRREALHAPAARPQGGRRRRRRRRRGGARGQRPADREHPARHHDPQHRADPGQGRPDRPVRGHRPPSCWPRRASTPRSACRRARCAAISIQLHGHRRPGRQPRSREPEPRQGRPRPAHGPAPRGPGRRHEPA